MKLLCVSCVRCRVSLDFQNRLKAFKCIYWIHFFQDIIKPMNSVEVALSFFKSPTKSHKGKDIHREDLYQLKLKEKRCLKLESVCLIWHIHMLLVWLGISANYHIHSIWHLHHSLDQIFLLTRRCVRRRRKSVKVSPAIE